MTRACPICGGGRSRPLFSAADLNARVTTEEFAVVRCRCGMAFLDPVPDDLGRYYPANYDAHREPAERKQPRKGSKRFRRLDAMAPGRLLDVGCGSGFDLLTMRQRGWTVAGVEMNPQAVERARAQGLDVRRGTIEEARLPAGSFDVVTLFHVLEHLPDPVGVAREAARVLRPGGILLAQVPNFGGMNARLFRQFWYELDVPRHVNFFAPATLKAAVAAAGLSVASLRWIESAADFRRSLERRWKVRLLSGRPVRAMLRSAFRALNLFRTGDMLEVVARKGRQK